MRLNPFRGMVCLWVGYMCLMSTNPLLAVDAITLSSGEQVAGRIISENETQIVVEVSNANRTIFSNRTVSKSDIKTVRRESSEGKKEREPLTSARSKASSTSILVTNEATTQQSVQPPDKLAVSSEKRHPNSPARSMFVNCDEWWGDGAEGRRDCTVLQVLDDGLMVEMGKPSYYCKSRVVMLVKHPKGGTLAEGDEFWCVTRRDGVFEGKDAKTGQLRRLPRWVYVADK